MPRMSALWAGLWDGEGYAGAEFRVVTADGTERWCTSAGAPVLDENRRQVGVEIRHAGVTGRRHIEVGRPEPGLAGEPAHRRASGVGR